ncbi:MAG: hypothetical protein IJZ55_06800 [Lachnospiraceae bacterium]|nr:hypothetical protein [Lachnospiraceae bacterium]
MTKHIIIAGVPRAGKSTVSQMIAKKFGYQHISMDSIIAGFEKTFPNVGIDTGADVDVKENVQSISAKIAPFLRAMMDSGEYDECDYGMVIDVFQLLPEDYRKHMDPSVCEIHYFITSDVTAEKRFELLKQYDTPKDYTYYKPEEENRRDCAEIVEISTYFKEQCEKWQLPYYETAQNREKVLGEFIKQLKNE